MTYDVTTVYCNLFSLPLTVLLDTHQLCGCDVIVRYNKGDDYYGVTPQAVTGYPIDPSLCSTAELI